MEDADLGRVRHIARDNSGVPYDRRVARFTMRRGSPLW